MRQISNNKSELPSESQLEKIRQWIIKEFNEEMILYDEFNEKFRYIQNFLEKYMTPKDLIMFLNKIENYKEILYPDLKEDYYPLGDFWRAAIAGVKSNDIEFHDITTKLIKKILQLFMKLIIEEDLFTGEDYIDYFLLSIFSFFNAVYKAGAREVFAEFFVELDVLDKKYFETNLDKFMNNLPDTTFYYYNEKELDEFYLYLDKILKIKKSGVKNIPKGSSQQKIEEQKDQAMDKSQKKLDDFF